jgi:hypothetical protein
LSTKVMWKLVPPCANCQARTEICSIYHMLFLLGKMIATFLFANTSEHYSQNCKFCLSLKCIDYLFTPKQSLQ